MSWYKVVGMPTVDNDGNLVGMISSTDLVNAYSEVGFHSRLIKNVTNFE